MVIDRGLFDKKISIVKLNCSKVADIVGYSSTHSLH